MTKFWLPISILCVMLAGCAEPEHAYRDRISRMTPFERCMDTLPYEGKTAAAVKECRETVQAGLVS